MGSGKSTIGRHLAGILGYDFVDLDQYIEQEEHCSVTEIFKIKGELYFRKQESYYLSQLLEKNTNIVLSLGGGTPCYANNMEQLKANHIVSCYLKLSPTSLAERLFEEKDQRPLISHINNKEALQEFIGIHLFERQPFYSQAKQVFTVDNLSVKNVVELIVRSLY